MLRNILAIGINDMASTAPLGALQTPEFSSLRHRLTVSDYHKMGAAGILSEATRVELIEGALIDMAPIGIQHAGKIKRIIRLFAQAIGERAIIDAQNPVILDNYSEPRPDITLLRSSPDFYETAHPRPEDVLLLIEVADTAVRYDREVKIPLYARSRIAEAWLLDLPQQQLEIYLEPSIDGYRKILRPGPDERITLSQLPETMIQVADLFS